MTFRSYPSLTSYVSMSDEEQNGVLRASASCWWRTPVDFDENGHFKIDISDLSSLTPRLKVVREMERLAFIASEGLDDLRHRLLIYKSGDFWLPIGGIKKEELNIPPLITVVLTGLSSSGKSSFVNLMYSVLGRSGLIPFAQTTSGESSTMYLEEHNVLRSPRSGFCVYDTRGLDQDQMKAGMDEISSWMNDGVRHNEPCHRPSDLNGPEDRLNCSSYLRRRVNCVMVVADLSRIHKAFHVGGDHLKSLEALKDLFHFPAIKKANENPLLILTHGDTLKAEERINGRLKVCEYLGISETSGAYDIPCLTEHGILAEEYDPVTAFALTEAVYRALLQSDRTHIPKKKFKDWIVLILSWFMWCIASFFALLANFFAKFVHREKKLKI